MLSSSRIAFCVLKYCVGIMKIQCMVFILHFSAPRFLLDLDIAAPKITIPTEFRPDNLNATKLLLDLGKFKLCTQVNSGTYIR